MSQPLQPRRWSRPAAGLMAIPLLLVVGLCMAQTPRVAIVDMQRLLDEAPQMVAARERLTREFAPRDAELARQREQLRQMEGRLREQGGQMPAEAARRLAEEVEVLRRALERAEERLREELAARNREERDRVWGQLGEAVSRYARDNGIDLVLPTPVLYASARIDITDRVLDLLRRDAAEARP